MAYSGVFVFVFLIYLLVYKQPIHGSFYFQLLVDFIGPIYWISLWILDKITPSFSQPSHLLYNYFTTWLYIGYTIRQST